MTNKASKRRRARHSAWHWKQTDCWYYTPPATSQRVPLLDEAGQRIRGLNNRQAAELAMARLRVDGKWRPEPAAASEELWVVARVCSEYLGYCERKADAGDRSAEHFDNARRHLIDFCSYCGRLSVGELTKGHVRHWLEIHSTWRSPATHRNAIASVLAAFNYAQDNFDVHHALKGLKKPSAQPRLQSISREDEEAIYKAADEPFREFLFAAIHTGLRPYCELARLTADAIEETPRGLMWRVYSSKTKKTRKIPVRQDVATLTRKLMASAPPGSGVPLFRNPQGNAWLKVTGGSYFRKIRAKLGWEQDPVRGKYSSYTCRHTFAHRMLAGYWTDGVGCSIEVLAELMGDSPKVAFDHYGRAWGQHYQEPLWAAIGIPLHRPSKCLAHERSSVVNVPKRLAFPAAR